MRKENNELYENLFIIIEILPFVRIIESNDIVPKLPSLCFSEVDVMDKKSDDTIDNTTAGETTVTEVDGLPPLRPQSLRPSPQLDSSLTSTTSYSPASSTASPSGEPGSTKKENIKNKKSTVKEEEEDDDDDDLNTSGPKDEDAKCFTIGTK